MNGPDLAGTIPALIVPMRHDYSIDFGAFRRYVEWVVAQHPIGIAVNVDTGEYGYLTTEERGEVVKVAREVAGAGCAVVAGVGGPGTAAATANARQAAENGADALLVFPAPAFLNEPLDSQIVVEYHRAIAEASSLPLIAFNLSTVFGGVPYGDIALSSLLQLENIVALKDASFDGERFLEIRDLIRHSGRNITLLTGNDTFLLEAMLMGAQGELLGYGAVGAALLIQLHETVKRRDFDAAVELQPRVQGFCDYIYGLPMGNYRARCKVALVHMGLLAPELTYVRPPFPSLWEAECEQARRAVEAAGLLGIATG